MGKKLKQVSEGQGFICETLEDKKRIWQKLTDAGYEMVEKWENCAQETMGIKWFETHFGSIKSEYITHPLNESNFFDEWTPQAGEWVEVCDDGKTWFKHDYKFIFEHKGVYYCETSDIPNLLAWKYIRPKPETMTLQEVREALGKPNLVIEG